MGGSAKVEANKEGLTIATEPRTVAKTAAVTAP